MNKNINNIVPYTPSERGGDSVRYKLDWNEGFADIRELVQQSLDELVQSPAQISQYVEPNYAQLTRAAREFYLRGNEGVACLPFAGSDSAISVVAATFLSEHDTVVMPVPSCDNARLEFQIRTMNINSYRVDLSNPLDLNHFIAYCRQIGPSMIYLVNPSNPVGYILDLPYIKTLATELPDTIILIDEAYIEFSGFDSAIGLIQMHQNILVTRTLSKAFSLASLRVGFLFGSQKCMALVNKVRNTKAISFFSATVATRALLKPGYMFNYVERIIRQRKDIEAIFRRKAVKYSESFGNFVVFQDVEGGISKSLLDAGILFRDRAKDFGQPGWIRLTLCPDILLDGIIYKNYL